MQEEALTPFNLFDAHRKSSGSR